MKKFIAVCIMLIILPLKVKAASIESTNIQGTNQSKVGENFSLSFNVNIAGIQKGSAESLGIAVVGYELVFDDNVFEVINVTSESQVWDSEIYKEDGRYYVLSTITEHNKNMNKCIDGILYCADYMTTIHFSVKDTTETETSILMGNVEVGLLNMFEHNQTYTEEDIINNMITIEDATFKSKVISIKREENIEQKSEVVDKSQNMENNVETNVDNKVVNIDKTPNTDKTTNVKKSNNKYIKTLTIENYNINFNKEVNNYNLVVENDVNSLKINVELEDSKATYKIKGAYNLHESNYKVLIVVTAENGEKNTYTINVNQNKKDEIVTSKEDESFKLDSRYIKLGIIIGGVILIVIIIICIINHVNNKKIDKAFEDI